jgi:predicted DNA binding CopG/RHH family protein
MMMTNAHNVEARDPWETGELGQSLEHATVASAEEMQAVDDSLGLQLVSIRLQKKLIATLKLIAAHHGIGYQPMVRDLLNRFAVSEIQQILQSQLAEAKKQADAAGGDGGPVSEFLERERKRA